MTSSAKVKAGVRACDTIVKRRSRYVNAYSKEIREKLFAIVSSQAF
jgi:hypothetical protein